MALASIKKSFLLLFMTFSMATPAAMADCEFSFVSFTVKFKAILHLNDLWWSCGYQGISDRRPEDWHYTCYTDNDQKESRGVTFLVNTKTGAGRYLSHADGWKACGLNKNLVKK